MHNIDIIYNVWLQVRVSKFQDSIQELAILFQIQQHAKAHG